MKQASRGFLVLLVMLGLGLPAHAQNQTDDEKRLTDQIAAALTNDAKAQFELAKMYEDGVGTPQDLRLAHLWYNKSAGQGYAPAVEKLANWEREREEAELRRKRAEEQARRKAEAEAEARKRAQEEAAARAARERAEEQARRKAQAEAAARKRAAQEDAAAKAARERAEEQARRKAEANARTMTTKSPPPAEPSAPTPGEAASSGADAVAADAQDGSEFSTNPCKTPTAKFTSTCQ